MAGDTIRRLLFTPPVAVARLGGSTTPMEAFSWGPGDPHTIAETRIRPDWTLDVRCRRQRHPRAATTLDVRDGPLLRPVAPFLELWALTGDGPADELAAAAGHPRVCWPPTASTAAAVTFTVDAMNRKAARRTGNPALRFGTFPPVTIAR